MPSISNQQKVDENEKTKDNKNNPQQHEIDSIETLLVWWAQMYVETNKETRVVLYLPTPGAPAITIVSEAILRLFWGFVVPNKELINYSSHSNLHTKKSSVFVEMVRLVSLSTTKNKIKNQSLSQCSSRTRRRCCNAAYSFNHQKKKFWSLLSTMLCLSVVVIRLRLRCCCVWSLLPSSSACFRKIKLELELTTDS